jgi:hypothetical protein
MNCDQPDSARRDTSGETGVALVVTILLLMLISLLMLGFVTSIIADQRASALGGDQTQAYGAAHAGLEKLTSDLADVFAADVSPSAAQVSALAAGVPSIPGFQFVSPGGTSGYSITFLADAQGNPAALDAAGTTITSGPFEGFRGIIIPYEITVTARSQIGAEVRMRRTLQNVAIPVFQFGMFSESDLSFFAGPNFNFGGRVHTNGNLFLAEGNGATLTMADRVTAVGEVIRTNLSNGWSTATNYTGNVNIRTSSNSYRNLARNEGSLVGTIPSALNEAGSLWTNLSVGTYSGNVRNGRTGARRLDLPLVSQGAQPIDLIRRPAATEDAASPVFAQRFFGLAGIRILLSDTAAAITGLPTVTSAAPEALNQAIGGAPLAVAGAGAPYTSAAGTPLVGGFIKIERRDAAGAWRDVTLDVLALGTTSRNLSSGTLNTPSPAATPCAEPQPDAVIRLQRIRDVPAANAPCGVGAAATPGTDYWPLALYDTREGKLRDSSTGNIALGGIMHYVELDVNNLRRYLAGQIGTFGAQTRSDNGYIVYFSDRRNNRNTGGQETGEYGFEDVVNPGDAAGAPNNALDAGEDLNTIVPAVATLETYGRVAVNIPASALTPFLAGALPTTTTTDVAAARANRPVHFRRALKLVNGAVAPILPGLTIAAENPIYVQGNYNSEANDTTTGQHGAYAVIADAVTLLSNNWNDIRSFVSPASPASRTAVTTGYRMAIIAGKSVSFALPTYSPAPTQDFGTDGGAHNFLRYLENWAGHTLNYRGSIVSFYASRQAVGTFKCCTTVYGAPTRAYVFDTEFLTPALLPPGTPMFRDVNTLTFRQMLRPNQ